MSSSPITIFWLLMGGAGATLLGFVFSIGWELWKERRHRIKQEQRFKRAILAELEENLTLCFANQAKFITSLEALEKNKLSLVTPHYLNTNCWMAVMVSGETAFVDERAYYELSRLYSTIQSFNNELKSREQFWANNRALGGFGAELKIRDELLCAGAKFILEKSEEIAPKLKP